MLLTVLSFIQKKSIHFTALLLLCRSSTLFSQNSDIVYTHFGRNNHLASNQVSFVMEDKKGFRWFATSNGLHSFDGSRWRWFKQEKDKPGSLPDNTVSSLLEDDQERFWVLSLNRIFLMNRSTSQFYNVPVEEFAENRGGEFRSLVQLKDKNIWLTRVSGSLYRYDETVKKFLPESKIINQKDYKVYQFDFDSSANRYWLGTNKGLVIYDARQKLHYTNQYNPEGITALNFPAAQKKIFTLHCTPKRLVWFSAGNTHSCYDIAANKIVFCDSVSKIWGIIDYTTDATATTWGYGSGLYKMNLVSGKAEPIEKQPNSITGIDFKACPHFFEDSEHNYWIATTDNGVFTYNRFHTGFLQHPVINPVDNRPLNNFIINSFIQLPNKNILAFVFAGEQSGIYHFDEQLNPLKPPYKIKQAADISCAYNDLQGSVWIGTTNGTLLKFFPETGKTEKIADTLFGKNIITCITTDKAGNLWVGSSNRSVVKIESGNGRLTYVGQRPETGLDNVYCLWYNGNGYIWAGTYQSGLLKINAATGKIEKIYNQQTNEPSSKPLARIGDIIDISPSELMLTTSAGIVIMHTEKETFRLLNTGDGLPENGVDYLIKTEGRNIWFTATNSISRLHLPDMKITNYSMAEGLRPDLTFGTGGKIRLSDGRILLNNNKGFTSFNPANVTKESGAADVKITAIRLFDRYLNIDSILQSGEGLRLDYNENFLTIEFSNMSFLNRNKVEYYYQLEGIDKNWIKADDKLNAIYTYLPGGRYIFRVKCITKDGTSSKNITTLTIRIIPPYWQRWWFYLLCISLAAGIILLIRKNKLRRKKETEAVRSRIARDLHDDIGSTLSTINILSEMAKMKLEKEPPVTKEYIEQISENSNRIMESMDDIVWSINPVNDSMDNVVTRMREFAGNLLEAKNIAYVFKEDKNIKHANLPLEKRHDFLMIFKEAVNNLAKYSECTQSVISIHINKNNLLLSVKDNGKGFDASATNNGNGLNNMKKRALSLGGVINITSVPGGGTLVELAVPL
jgi:signal transduction histidine kinase/ligand-binding sensor domain-containing protein